MDCDHRGVANLLDRGRKVRPLVRFAQTALTGGYVRRMHAAIAADLEQGPHGSILDLGCGDSPLLHSIDPERYVGLDFNPRSLAVARRRYGGEGREWVEGDVTSHPLDDWRGIDAVVCSALFHHLPDEQITALSERIVTEAAPARIVCADTLMIGALKGVIARLDEGEPVRSKDELYALLEPRFEIEPTWSFEVPLRTAHLWGFVLTPRRP